MGVSCPPAPAQPDNNTDYANMDVDVNAKARGKGKKIWSRPLALHNTCIIKTIVAPKSLPSPIAFPFTLPSPSFFFFAILKLNVSSQFIRRNFALSITLIATQNGEFTNTNTNK